MERKDWTLLVINAAGPSGLSPVQLQKCLFLIGKNLPEVVGDSFYQFIPYNYGPFDQAIYVDAQRLIDEKLVTFAQVAGKTWGFYIITLQGEEAAERIEPQVSPAVLTYIGAVVAWVQQLSFTQLLSAIYQQYPEYRANSVFLR